MIEWTPQQRIAIEKYAREHGIDHEQAVIALNEIKQIFLSIKNKIQNLMTNIRPYLEAYKRYWHKQNVKFFKKKNSQRKNWNKWKKRNRY